MIEPVYLTTNNIARELLRIAAQNAISSSDLYIDISSVKSLMKKDDSEFTEIDNEDLNRYKSEKYLRDLTIKFEQQYEVTIKSQHDDYPLKDMICEVEIL